MGALPKKKLSGMRRGNRRRYHVIRPLPLTACSNCGSLKPTHRVCRLCGFYNGNQVLKIKAGSAAE